MHRSVLSAIAVVAVLTAAHPVYAQSGGGVDPKVALPILMKVLTYDRNFGSRGGGEFVVLIASEEGKTPSVDLVEIAKTMKLVSVQDRPLRFVHASFKDQPSLDAAIQAAKAKAVLAAPGSSAAAVKDISEVAQDNQIYTMSMEVAPVEQALAIGVADKDGRPQIVINLNASKAIGAVFDSSVLKLARVIQ
ncbi:MAG: YfiR/HmsC family protein [Myxococcaceae bacterium]